MVAGLRRRIAAWRPRRPNGSAGKALPAVDLSPRELHFDDAALEARLTWIWGSPRSGSTWLLKMLADPLQPDPETALGFRPPDGEEGPFDVVPVDESFISNHLAPALADPRRIDGTWVPGTLNNYLAANKPAYALSHEYRDVWMPEARRFALVRLQGVLDRAAATRVPLTERPHVAIKETNGSHAADLVMSLLPRSRIVLLIRDGRDVVDSLLDAYKPGSFLANNQRQSFGTPAERAERLRWAGRLWACNTDMTLRAMAAHDPALCRTVRYEDLLADPAGELRDLYRWIGLDRSGERVTRMAAAHSFECLPESEKGPRTRNRAARPGLWREKLSDEEQRVLAEIFGDRLERFGYAA